MRLKDLRAAEYNPRKISDEALSGLKASLRSFGDISGIVFNKRTGNLVSGHQRVRALAEEHGDDIQIFQEGYEGRIKLPDGTHVRVRYVDWDESMEKAANVAANNPHTQGEWTLDVDDIIAEIQCELPELSASVNIDLMMPPPKTQPSAEGDGVSAGDIDPLEEWNAGGMPEYEQEKKAPYKEVIVRFETQEAVEEFERRLEITLPPYEHRKNIWYPKKKIQSFGRCFADEGEEVAEDGVEDAEQE